MAGPLDCWGRRRPDDRSTPAPAAAAACHTPAKRSSPRNATQTHDGRFAIPCHPPGGIPAPAAPPRPRGGPLPLRPGDAARPRFREPHQRRHPLLRRAAARRRRRARGRVGRQRGFLTHRRRDAPRLAGVLEHLALGHLPLQGRAGLRIGRQRLRGRLHGAAGLAVGEGRLRGDVRLGRAAQLAGRQDRVLAQLGRGGCAAGGRNEGADLCHSPPVQQGLVQPPRRRVHVRPRGIPHPHPGRRNRHHRGPRAHRDGKPRRGGEHHHPRRRHDPAHHPRGELDVPPHIVVDPPHDGHAARGQAHGGGAGRAQEPGGDRGQAEPAADGAAEEEGGEEEGEGGEGVEVEVAPVMNPRDKASPWWKMSELSLSMDLLSFVALDYARIIA